jgi:hypothetical protein
MRRYAFLFLTVAVAMAILAITLTCVKRKNTQMINERSRSIEQVFDTHRDSLLSIPGVVGAGIARLDEKPCIMVMVRQKSDSTLEQIPKELDGYEVIVEETGQLKALGKH